MSRLPSNRGAKGTTHAFVDVAPIANGTYGVAFRIWSQKASTEPGDQSISGQEYHLAVADGIFNVILYQELPFRDQRTLTAWQLA